MWVWKRLHLILYTEHKTNEEVLKLIHGERTILETMRQIKCIKCIKCAVFHERKNATCDWNGRFD